MVDKFKDEIRDMRNVSLVGIIVATVFFVILLFSFGNQECPINTYLMNNNCYDCMKNQNNCVICSGF